MEVWGITGVIGSGKSTAVAYLKTGDYPVIDADQVSRIVVDKDTEDGKEGFAKIYRAFGASVLNNLGQLDRRALRLRMMRNPEDRQILENILHPLIVEYIKKQMTKWKESGADFGFIEGSRLIESGFHNMLQGIVVVTAQEKHRVKRVMERDSMGRDEVIQMFSLQDERLMKQIAKYEWKNNKDLDHLQDQIDVFITERADKLEG